MMHLNNLIIHLHQILLNAILYMVKKINHELFVRYP